MIPLYLKISGIYSYRQQQEIDFQKLTAAHLFGIFGAVGSGKSALLEAIVFVLYGESERLNSRDLRAYNMMNLKCNEALIQFDFLAPGNKGKYRAMAKGKRNSRNKEDVKFERALYKFEDNNLLPIEVDSVESLIGISYENFRRTIIIPQGKFQEFLQLGSTARTDMLKELFSLHRFDLSFKTGSLQKKNDESLNNCLGRLQQLGDVTGEDLLKIKAELEELIRELTETGTRLKEKETAEAGLQELLKLQTSLENNRLELKDLESGQEEVNRAEQRLNDYYECESNFKTDFTLFDDKNKQLVQGEAGLKEKKSDLVIAEVRNTENEARFNLARKGYENRETLSQMAKDLETCARINNRLKAAELLAERIRNGEIQVTEAEKTIESLKVQHKEVSGIRETLKAQLPDLNRIQQARNWFSKQHLLREKKNSILQKESAIKAELTNIGDELRSHYAVAGQQVPGEAGEYQNLPALLEVKRRESESALNKLISELIHLEVQDKLREFASDLREGEPCPLCGSKDHPHIAEMQGLDNELLQARTNKTSVETELKKLDNTITRSKLLLENFIRKNADLVAVASELKEAGSALSIHQQGNQWSGLTEEQLEKEGDRYNRIQEELDKLDEKLKETTTGIDAESLNHRKYSTLLNELKLEHGKTRQDADTLRIHLVKLDHSEYASITEEALMEQSKELMEQYRKAGEIYLSAEKALQESQSAYQTLNGSVSKMEESLVELKKGIEEIRKQLDVRILSSRFGSEQKIREILELKIDRLQEQNRIRAFRDKMASLTRNILELEKQLTGKVYDAEVHKAIRRDITEIRDQLALKNQQKGAKESELAGVSKDLDESARLKAELKTLETRKDNLKTLSDLFRSQAFVNYVSTIYLQNLVNSANERFYRLTRQQLKLELDPENNFRIRDYLNDGQWRNVKTLSGGQTFQASLCLALALADNIQQLNQGGQNFFFLDEGFGTLDKESLDMVFETLKSLRRENRIVGVISHVEDMQQEISSWLKIIRDEERGSVILTSDS